jgi:hypothetical protein
MFRKGHVKELSSLGRNNHSNQCEIFIQSTHKTTLIHPTKPKLSKWRFKKSQLPTWEIFFPFERCKEVHNFFIEKPPGLPLLDKIRVIHLYKVDWNLVLKYFISNKLTNLASNEETLAIEQARGRQGRKSSAMTTKTKNAHEICWLQRLHGAVIYSDAKACFDWIIKDVDNPTSLRETVS